MNPNNDDPVVDPNAAPVAEEEEKDEQPDLGGTTNPNPDPANPVMEEEVPGAAPVGDATEVPADEEEKDQPAA